jgi:hypothetical protein
MFPGADALLLRVKLAGFEDDASGTYTGTAGATIQLAPDIVRCLLVRWGGIDPSRIDLPSFVRGRAHAPEALAVYLGAPGEDSLEMSTVIERLENGAQADLVLDGEKFYWRPRETALVRTPIALAERDFLEPFVSDVGLVEDYFGTVIVAYGQDPGNAAWQTTQREAPAAALRWNRKDPRTFATYLGSIDFLATPADAQQLRARLDGEIEMKRRRFQARAKGRLVRAPLASLVTLTRARGVGTSGALSEVLARLVGRVSNPVTWETVADLIEVVGMRKIFSDVVSRPTVGAAETEFWSKVIKPGTLEVAGQALRISQWGTLAANGNAKTLKGYFGATSISLLNAITTSGGAWKAEWYVQRLITGPGYQLIVGQGQAAQPVQAQATENLAGDVTLKATGQGTTSGDVIQLGCIVELIP